MALFAEVEKGFQQVDNNEEEVPANIFEDIDVENNPEAVEEEIFKQPPQRKARQERKQRTITKTSTRKAAPKTVKSFSGVDFKEIFDKTTPPTIQEFSKSTVIQTFAWFIKNIPKENPGQIMINTKEKIKIDVPKITIKEFPKFVKELYPLFCYVYKVNRFLKEIRTNYSMLTITLKGRKVKQGNTVVFELPAEEFDNNLKEYKRQLLYLQKNIDFSAINGDKVFQFLELKINSTSNAYEWSEGDFDKFCFTYQDDEEYLHEPMTNEEKIKAYHEIFTKNIIGKPAEIFKRRETFLETVEDDLLEEDRENTLKDIEKFDFENIPEKSREEVKKYLETFAYMLKTETFRNIIFKCYTPNNILEKVLVKFFNSKHFLSILDNGINRLSYLFTPRCFWSNSFGTLAKPHEKKVLANRRKSFIGILMTMDDATLLKNNSWWTYFVNPPETSPENIWEITNDDIIREDKKKLQAEKKKSTTPNKQTGKTEKKKAPPKLEDENEEEEQEKQDEEQKDDNNDFEEFEI